MRYRILGRTGAQVSELCLGCMMFGGRTDEGSSFDIIDRAIDSGIKGQGQDEVSRWRRNRRRGQEEQGRRTPLAT